MGFSNNMTDLLDKVEIKLGMEMINLPEKLSKDKWAKVIQKMTLVTWSRFFSHKINYTVEQNHYKNGYYLIDEKIVSNAKILGVRDLNWNNLTPTLNNFIQTPYDMYSMYTDLYDMETASLVQARTDQFSLFNLGLFVDFVPPNKIIVTDANNKNVFANVPYFNIEILIQHPDSLTTISPTMMEKFDELSVADVATFLYNNLKYYDNLETVFGNIDIKLDDLKAEADKREQIIQDLQDNYISAGNVNQPMIFSI